MFQATQVKSSLKILMATLLSIIITACSSSGTDIESDLDISGAPDWVNEGTTAVSDNDGKYLQGVGMSVPVHDESLQKSAADSRARAQIAQILSTFMDVSIDDYMANNGDIGTTNIEREIKALSKTSLNGSKIMARWKDPETGNIYSFAELDLDKVEEMIKQSSSMNNELKLYLNETMNTKFDRFIKQNESENK
ncbi:hypothetical protein [Thalassomonas sp. M1454]|uniref:hypothetical protein n=1 Tax=Thalassomonas sp. M1454 TaxID=2594477 RepID=UPI00163DCF6A|nr:hypothetical protein [Thalassomonas sp. M1454]